MIAWVMNQLRMGKCEHEFEWFEEFVRTDIMGSWTVRTGICKRCGYRRRFKLS